MAHLGTSVSTVFSRGCKSVTSTKMFCILWENDFSFGGRDPNLQFPIWNQEPGLMARCWEVCNFQYNISINRRVSRVTYLPPDAVLPIAELWLILFPTKLNALTKDANKFLGNRKPAANCYEIYGTNSNKNPSFVIDQNAKQMLLFSYIE